MAICKVALKVVAKPNQKKDELWRIDDTILAKVAAPAVNGKATAHLEKVLAKYFGLAPSLINVAKGQRSKTKIVVVLGEQTEILRLINLLPIHPKQESLF